MDQAGLAAIIASTLPLIVAIFCWLFLGERTKMMGLFGLVAGFGGVILIMSQGRLVKAPCWEWDFVDRGRASQAPRFGSAGW